ncbi:Trehalose synthase [Candidatus Methylacidithermus pantelleriae]|uniref:maltose alpha-D-glucosyltransferase n=1 Tax=Candidatus Methylacidithermus pantelleriae TaxID=2744239 RepID=A0A8J2FX84_9BACT|nr:Trehalose synthase [Candidatus Methylacidithermus pantelleriae]
MALPGSLGRKAVPPCVFRGRRDANVTALFSSRTPPTDPFWYKDAIIYELHVRAFFDSNGDGIGDFPGLTSKVDYLEKLGVTAVWLLPFYPSPLKDDGYDISDYTNVHPAYGTLRDFQRFLEEAHKRGIRVITELVLNHTSDQHPWFQRARHARPGSRWREFYVWSETPERYRDARIIFQDFETSNWTWDPLAKAYYWHRFYSHQPDLNYENPEVRREILKVIDFWLGMGVDGLRLDAVPYLFEKEGTTCENLPETHAFLKEIRAFVDRKYPGRMLLAEANQWPEDAVAYFGQGDECHMAFHFPLMPRLYIALQSEERYPIVNILEQTPAIPDNCQWAIFLRNHDELTLEMVTDEERDYMYRVYAREGRARLNLGIRRRLAPLLGNNRKKIELLFTLLFSLPGTPILYYGDEIGMGDNMYLGDRNGVRTPMQWSGETNAGFSTANPQKLYLPVVIDPEYHYQAVNVELQERNTSSLLWWVRRTIDMRKRLRALARGSLRLVFVDNPKVLAFTREWEGQIVLVVLNLSRFSQLARLDLREWAGMTPIEPFGRTVLPPIRTDDPLTFLMGPYDHFWLLLSQTTEPVVHLKDSVRPLVLVERPTAEYWESETGRRVLAQLLPDYLPSVLGRLAPSAAITDVSVWDYIEMEPVRRADSIFWLFVSTNLSEGSPMVLALPLFVAEADAARQLLLLYPESVLVRYQAGQWEGVLADIRRYPGSWDLILDFVAGRRRASGHHGFLCGRASRESEELRRQGQLPPHTKLIETEPACVRVIYGQRFLLKLYRILGEGEDPDAEMVRYLSEKCRFPHVPQYMGALEYHREDGARSLVALLLEHVTSEQDAWKLTIGVVERYLEHVLEVRPPVDPLALWKEPIAQWPASVRELVDEIFLGNLRLLADRTAQMHLALGQESDDPDFNPEPFTPLYQRSLFQSGLELLAEVNRLFKERTSSLPPALRDEAPRWGGIYSRLKTLLGAIVNRKLSGAKIRVHGDYQLEKVLYTGKDFVITDFEGDPFRPASERRLKRPALRDAATMLQSLRFAAFSSLRYSGVAPVAEFPYLSDWIHLWYKYTSTVFLESYYARIGPASFLPTDPADRDVLLQFCLIERALGELIRDVELEHDRVAFSFYALKLLSLGPETLPPPIPS